MALQLTYPRPLTSRERAWLRWILPAERSGYGRYREFVDSAVVIGEGRRGIGEIILGVQGDVPDLSAPLPPVIAYGVVETDLGTLSVTLRDIVERQCSVEIVSNRSDALPEDFEEGRRWTYSTWNPGQPCPQCLAPTREVSMRRGEDRIPAYVLALCAADRRIWIHESSSGMNRLIPVTNFYNEVMLQKHIRDPKIALDSKRLFTNLAEYSDADLQGAFERYNSMMTKIRYEGNLSAGEDLQRSWIQRMWTFLRRR